MFTAQTVADLNRQRFAAENVKDRQRAELLTIAELIVDEAQERWLRLLGQFPADFRWISAGVY